MKPLHIALLLTAGAGGGALVMMIAQHQPLAPPPPMTAESPTQSPAEPPKAPVPAGAAAVATPPAEAPSPVVKAEVAQDSTARPSPWEAPKPGRANVKATASASKPSAAAVRPTPPPVAAAPPTAPPDWYRPQPQQPAVTERAVPPVPSPAAQTPPARVELPEQAAPPQPPPPPEPHKVTLNAGTLFSVRLVDGLSAERNAPGDPFTGTLDKELVADGFVIAERGARVEGRVSGTDPGGRVRGVSSIAVQLTRIRTSDGQTVTVRTDPFERRAEANHVEDAEKIGAGAVIGAAIGAIAGGGKGAAIGAGAGGAAGAGTVLATRGKPAALPSETRITFRLAAPVTLTERK